MKSVMSSKRRDILISQGCPQYKPEERTKI